MKLLYCCPTLANPFWERIVAGMSNRAAAEGVTLEVLNAEDSEDRQTEQLQGLLGQHPDVVLVSPLGSDRTRSTIGQMMKAGTPVVAVDQNLGSEVTASVISGNMGGGVALGQFVASKLDKPGRLLHLKAQAELQNLTIRRQSFLSCCQGEHMLAVVTRVAGGSRAKAREAVEQCLNNGLEFLAIFGENDVMALGAVDALNARDYKPWPLIVGFDAIEEAMYTIVNDQMAATVLQRPEEMGSMALETALLIARKQPFEKLTTLDTILVTADNVDEYIPKVNTIRAPPPE